MSKEGTLDEVIVERRLGLTGINGSEGAVRRLVGRLKDKGFSEVELEGEKVSREVTTESFLSRGLCGSEGGRTNPRDVFVVLVLLPVVVDEDTSHRERRHERRVLLLEAKKME